MRAQWLIPLHNAALLCSAAATSLDPTTHHLEKIILHVQPTERVMPRHIYFVAPERPLPTGGINVMYQFAEILRDHGYSVSVHYQSPDFVYEFFGSDIETTYSRYSEPRPPMHQAPYKHFLRWRQEWRKPRKRGANRLSVPGHQDLVVVPDFWGARQFARFPGVPVAVLAQDVGGLIRGSLLPMARDKMEIPLLQGFVTTSKSIKAAVEAFSDKPHWYVPLFLEAEKFQFQDVKKRQICFLDRKRPGEVAAMREFLKKSLADREFDLVAVRNLLPPALRKIMADSLFFLSFSQEEGFGLPPAEAMAMGCITIGYTGVGGNEYFTPDVAFPVPEDDIVAFHRKILEVVEAYERNPAPLDAMRRKASKQILTTYTKEKTIPALLKAFEDIAT